MDVDVDVKTSFDARRVFPAWTRASRVQDGKLLPHPVGVYPQAIPVDDLTKLAAIPFDAAEDLGYLKVDLLHVSAYNSFNSRAEIEELASREPDWGLLLRKSVQEKLFQLSKHGDLLDVVRPTSVLELADCMALIRPGKKKLIGIYRKEPVETRRALYAQDAESGYAFKKSHAVAYALVVVLQLHLAAADRL